MAKLFKKRQEQKPATVIPPLSSLPWPSDQAKKALDALVAHSTSKISEAKDNGDLLAGEEGGNEDTVSVVVTVKLAAAREKHKPILIPLPNPLLDPRQSPVCLFVKDPQREFKDLLASNGVTFISRVVGISKLRGKHAPFEARRQLRKSHSLFLADKRIIPLLPPLLGNAFIQSKALPVPVEIGSPSPSLKAELERAVGGTTLRLGTGTCLNVKIGSLSRHSVDELQANLEEIVRHLAAKVPMGGWDNVQALHVKSGTSVALPVWNCGVRAGEGGRFSGQTEEVPEKRKRKREESEQPKKEGKEKVRPKEGKEDGPSRRERKDMAREERRKEKKTKKLEAVPQEPKVAEKKAVPEAELSLVDGAPIPTPISTKPAPVASAEAGTTSGLETKRSKKTKGEEPGVTTEETVKVHETPKRVDDVEAAPKEGKKPRKKVVEASAVPQPPVQPAAPATGGMSRGDRKALAASQAKPDGGDVPAVEKSAVKSKKSKDKDGKPRSSVGKKAKGLDKVKA